jgi:hypothetical protein
MLVRRHRLRGELTPSQSVSGGPRREPSRAERAAAALLPGSVRRFPELASVPWLTALGDGALANLGSAWTVVNRRALTLETSGALRVLCRAIRQSSFRTGCGATCSIAKFLKDDRWSSSIRDGLAPLVHHVPGR